MTSASKHTTKGLARGSGGETHHSDWYMGTMVETIPTPRPAKTRPTTNRGILVAAVCMATPTQKTRHAKTMPYLRPRLSEMGAPRRAPKKVPRERIDTTRDSVEVEIAHLPVPLFTGLPNVQSQSCICDERKFTIELKDTTYRHFLDTRDGSSVVAEENTAERGKADHDDSRPWVGRLA